MKKIYKNYIKLEKLEAYHLIHETHLKEEKIDLIFLRLLVDTNTKN